MNQKLQKQSKQQYQINRVSSFSQSLQQNASILSKILFLWTHQLIQKGNSKILQMNDLSDVTQEQNPSSSYSQFSAIFQSIPPKTQRIYNCFKQYFGYLFLWGAGLATLANILQFSGPIVITQVLNYLTSSTQPLSTGIWWVTVLLLCYLIRAFVFQHSTHMINLCCTKILNSSNGLIFTKILNLSGSSRKFLDAGTIMNHLNVDVMSIYYFLTVATNLISAPIIILTAIILIIRQVGWIGIATPIIFCIGVYIQQKIMNKAFIQRGDQLKWADKRSKAINQYFSGIRVIKFYGWQKLVQDKVNQIRHQQLSLNFKVLMVRAYLQILLNMLPIISSIVIFAFFVSINGQSQLTTAKVYAVLALFNIIDLPMRLVVVAAIYLANAKASLKRLQHFFGYQNSKQKGFYFDQTQQSYNEKRQVGLNKGQILFDNCAFTWESKSNNKHHAKKDKPDNKKSKKIKKKVKIDQKRDSILTQQESLKMSLLQNQQSNNKNVSNKKKNKKKSRVLTVKRLKVDSGQFISVVGRVGSGKSTLLYSILGQLNRTRGILSRSGSLAYIPQTSWLRSTTIRQNIIFQSPYVKQKFQQVIKICQLQPDLQILQGGDLTQIGQNGINLSGGQKQRISIARAIYADADIYLIDDCLSALDAYVGKNIFNNVILNYLHKRNKTIIFATNAMDLIQHSNRILVMEKGKIVQNLTPSQALKSQHSIFSQLIKQSKIHEQQQAQNKKKLNQEKLSKQSEDTFTLEDQRQEQVEKQKKDKKQKQLKGLVKVQQKIQGSVPLSFYSRFFRGPSSNTTLLMVLSIAISQIFRIGSDWWLGAWSGKYFLISQSEYIWIFAGLSIFVGVFMYLKGIFFVKFIISSSKIVQQKLIQKLLKSPLSWFDVTPNSRILTRTTKDQDDLDNSLSFNVQYALQHLIIILSSIILISIATPLYLIIAILTFLAYIKIFSLYMNSSREIKRLEANTRGPLVSHIQQTINGIRVIKAHRKTEVFTEKFFIKQKDYIVAMVNQNICARWIGLVTELFTVLTMAAAGYLGVLSKQIGIGGDDNNLIGLGMLWAFQISSILPYTLKILGDTQSNMNAVVRIYDYIDNNPQEKSFNQPHPQQFNWPSQGQYKIDKISYKYRPDLPTVIKNISFDVRQNAKIGIVGRTGSGKSTLTLGLLRILQLCQNQDKSIGKIILDDEDISSVGLHFIRNRITIIPQDPTLFTGTIKSNIDPFGLYKDQQIEQSLQKVDLWQDLRQNEDFSNQRQRKINSKIEQSGSNFSLGQKQLICMARALIRKPKVLLMDEATASIDQKTDKMIQKMIKKQFINTTVITIAHRLNTVIFYDKILVLDNGQIKQYGEPKQLIQNQDGFLGSIIRKTGEKNVKKLINLIRQQEK